MPGRAVLLSGQTLDRPFHGLSEVRLQQKKSDLHG